MKPDLIEFLAAVLARLDLIEYRLERIEQATMDEGDNEPMGDLDGTSHAAPRDQTETLDPDN